MAANQEKLKDGRRTARRATQQAKRSAEELAPEQGEELAAEVPRDEGDVEEQGGGDRETLVSELRTVARKAALEVLRPVAKKATASAAKYAVTKGPDLVKNTVAPK